MLRKNDDLLKRLPQLSGIRLVCHCRADQACHADSIITVYKELFPDAYNREDTTAAAPSAEVPSRLAGLREIPQSDDGSADEGAPARGAGWVGTGKPMQIGSGYTRRDMCDGPLPKLAKRCKFPGFSVQVFGSLVWENHRAEKKCFRFPFREVGKIAMVEEKSSG